jgi:hypothetical protein
MFKRSGIERFKPITRPARREPVGGSERLATDSIRCHRHCMSGEYHKTESHPASLEQETQTVIEEARMVLPGIQAVFGFQLMAVFNNGFSQLKPGEQVAHLVALLLVVIAIALIMTPASYHRIAEKGIVSRRFVELGSRLLAFAMLPLMLGITIDLFVVARLILNNVGFSVGIAALFVLLFLLLWFVFPWAERCLDRTAK